MKNILLLVICLISIMGFNQKCECPKFQILGDYRSNGYVVLYPIGWSEDGKFAYLHHDINPLGAAMIYRYNVIIQDMRTNEIIWSRTYENNYEVNPIPKNNEDVNKDTTKFSDGILRYIAWNEFKEEVCKQLTENKIVQSEVKIMPFSFFKDGYLIKEEEIVSKNDPLITTEYTILLARMGVKVAKLLYQYKKEPNEDGLGIDPYGNHVSYLSFSIMGHIKSPYSELYGMVVVQRSEGYEEPWEHPFVIGFSYE